MYMFNFLRKVHVVGNSFDGVHFGYFPVWFNHRQSKRGYPTYRIACSAHFAGTFSEPFLDTVGSSKKIANGK